MANATVDLTLDISNYVKKSDPYTVFKTNNTTGYRVDYNTFDNREFLLFGKVAKISNNLKHNVLIAYTITIAGYIASGDSSNNGVAIYNADNFDTNTIVYKNIPDIGDILGELKNFSTSVTNKTTSSSQNVQRLVKTLNDSVCIVGVYYAGALVKKVLANGSSLPYFTITYDNATKIKSKVSYSNSQLTGTINNAATKTITWDLVKDTSAVSGYCADETWEQSSAVFKYRVSGESTWQTISVSGTTKGVTIPAYTFASNTTYEYQISVTDEDNTTTETSVYTFTTARSQITPQNSPTSGYVNPRNAVTFSWYYANQYGAVNGGTSAFDWRLSGESWGEHLVTLQAGTNSVTIPADTFPTASTIEWYIAGRDATNQYSISSTYSFSTAAKTVTATAIEPSNSILSNNQETELVWRFSSSDGFAPSRYILQYKLITAVEWTELVDSTTIATSYTAQPYTFPAGEIQWRVIPYNIDDVIGTSVGASFISYGAPEEPVVYATETPFMTVTWQADDQQAYEIMVGSKSYGPYFGAEKSLDIPDYLEDGQYIVKVRVVGTYGLWSDWGTTATNIENVPGEDITLTGTEGISNLLSWETEEATANYLIYRDGVQIGHTESTQFEDRYTSGEHIYKVINKLPNDNYSESNEVTLDSEPDGVYIAPYNGGEWVKIDYTLKSQSDPKYDDSLQSYYVSISGHVYPSAILSMYRETVVGYSAVFFYNQEVEHQRFKSLFGKPVIMKFKDGSVIVGILDSWSRQPKKQYYTSYTFTIHCIEWEDYVDDTDAIS